MYKVDVWHCWMPIGTETKNQNHIQYHPKALGNVSFLSYIHTDKLIFPKPRRRRHHTDNKNNMMVLWVTTKLLARSERSFCRSKCWQFMFLTWSIHLCVYANQWPCVLKLKAHEFNHSLRQSGSHPSQEINPIKHVLVVPNEKWHSVSLGRTCPIVGWTATQNQHFLSDDHVNGIVHHSWNKISFPTNGFTLCLFLWNGSRKGTNTSHGTTCWS